MSISPRISSTSLSPPTVSNPEEKPDSIIQKTKIMGSLILNDSILDTYTEISSSSPRGDSIERSSISSPLLSKALMQELTTTKLTKLRATSQPVIETVNKLQDEDLQLSAIKSLSSFFILGYTNSPQHFPFQRDLPYEFSTNKEDEEFEYPSFSDLKVQSTFDLQDPECIKHNTLIRDIAALLIPRAHVINKKSITPLIEFLQSEGSCAAVDHIVNVLQQLSSSQTLQLKLTSIPSPLKNTPGENLVRLALNLPPGHEVASLEAQQAVLAALLSHCRQGKSGTCFATFLSIALMGSNLELCLDDFACLLIHNSLTRKTKDGTLTFPLNLTLLAATAFESQTYNPILRAWENAIAGMSEGAQNGFIKPQIVDSILFALERKLYTGVSQNHDLETRIEQMIKSTLQTRIQLQFSPDVAHGSPEDDGNSQQGAFIVYDTNHSSDSSQWQPVDSPSKFQEFIQLILNDAKDRLQQEELSSLDKINACFGTLSKYVSTDDFVIQSVKKCGYYQPKNSPPNFDNVDTSPWMFKTGANPKTTLQIYFEMEVAPEPKKYMIHDALHLIIKVAEHISIHQEWLSKLTTRQVFLPIAIQGEHVFSLIPKHPSLQSIPERNAEIAQWLEDNVENPGREISRSVLPESVRNKIIEACRKNFIPLENSILYLEDSEQIKAGVSLQEFRESLLKIMMKHSAKDEPQAKAALEIDTNILEYLSADQVKTLTERAIHFADTNGFQGKYRIHYGVMFNPGNEKLELWKIIEDNSKAIPIDQNHWLLDHPWEFFILT